VRQNQLKRRLAAGHVAVGCLLAYDAPWLVEVLGMTGYDFVTIDLEHEPIDDASVVHLTRAAEGVGLTTIARMPCSERIVPILSAGVQGIQVPDLESREHAEEIVRSTRYPPAGRRTYYTQTRAAQYGVGIDERTWTREANEELLVIATIEDIAVVDQLDAILAVDGIDAFHVGPLDLAQSMGNPSPEEVEEVIDEVVRRCRSAGRFAAVGVVTPWGLDVVEKRVDQGIQLVHVASAWLLTHSVAAFLGEIEERIPEGKRAPQVRSVARNPYLTYRR
jgi:2-keto-3-deoxy-L-rhamnonate aldolase RhmA